MKSSILVGMILGIAIVLGTMVYRNSQNVTPAPVSIGETTPLETNSAAVETSFAPKQKEPRVAPDHAINPPPAQVAPPASMDAKPKSAPTALTQNVNTLTSPQTSFSDKQLLWEKLKGEGGLDSIMAELKQRAVDNPHDPVIPSTLGQAELHKADVISRNGGNISEMGMLGMQADQSFDAALKLDPSNWEAQFFKAAALFHWPAEMNKGQEVIQRLSNLIDQQEATTSQPQYAQTYVILGEQYQKGGQPAYAEQTWRLGMARFPNEKSFQQHLAER